MSRSKFISFARPALLLCLAGVWIHCSDTEAPEPPASIRIVSGDHQFSRFGTELPEPFVVKLTTESGAAAAGFVVVFEPNTGGGSFSKGEVVTDEYGVASSHFTLGPAEGPNSAVAYVGGTPSLSVPFNATAGYTYCPEAETTLSVYYGTQGHLFLATSKSDLFPDYSGIIRIDPLPTSQPSSFIGFPTDIFSTQIWDIAFSPRGDMYISTSKIFDDVLITTTDGDYSFFAPLPDFTGSFSAAEITCNPQGLIVGCNNNGPFLVKCRGEYERFEEATYEGGINNDALAVDPVTDDIYFIHQNQHKLMRLPIDTLTAAGPVEILADLNADEAEGARGMVCDSDRMIYILVDTQSTKKIVRVSAASGIKTDVVDFFTRGSGSEEDAGMQRDLAIDTAQRILYTIDTLNNALLRYPLPGGPLGVSQQGAVISTSSAGGERVGLVVMK